MKMIRHFIQCTLIFGCLTHPLKALEQGYDIQIRIHAPFNDLYVGEVDYWLVRVENRGVHTIPVPRDEANENDEGPPQQFQVQTEEAARAAERPGASSWSEIQSFGNGLEALIDKSVLEPGKAMEAFTWGLPGQLRTPPNGGKFRLAMQVGPDNFVYSNWITKIKKDQPAPVMRIIHTGDPHGSGAIRSIGISENTDPPYLWYFPNKPAGRFVEPLLYRICEISKGMMPDVQIDQERGQYVISFPQGGPDTTYFAHRCGLSKSTPWPKGYRSKDFLLTAYPASAPSPIGFPMALFQENGSDIPNKNRPKTGSTDRSIKRLQANIISEGKEPARVNRSLLWILVISFILLAGLIAFLIRMRKA